MKKSNKKTLVLSVVAFVLILMSLVSFTYSWIDDIKLVEFQNDNLAQNGAPLKTGTDINATVNITKEDNTIDLGNMLTNNDLTYEYTENGETKRHIRYDSSSDNSKKPNMDDINEKKGYFYESGGMHLSPCYSDGETFYFPRQGQDGYREGNKDDENVNYISFTAKVSSPDATTDFWFDGVPYISKHEEPNSEHNTDNELSYARFAIIVDGDCHVYSNSGTDIVDANTIVDGSVKHVDSARKASVYAYNNDDNTTAERGKNSNTLFSIKKGNTVNVTIKIWLEGGVGTDVTASDINLKLKSSWAENRRIWIDDKTTNGSGGSWLDDDSAQLYLTFPQLLYDINPDPNQWNKENNRNKGLIAKLSTDSSSGKYYVDVPLVYNNEKMILYRCNNEGWNDDGSAVERSEYKVFCWNWWQTNTPNTYKDETYTLYGGSKDNTAKGYFGYDNSWVTDKGYGTWGAVEEIHVYSHYDQTDYASKGNNRALYIVDYSDEDTSRETYIYEMCRIADEDGNGDGKIDNDDPVDENDPWKTYVPVSSSKLKFRYFGAGDNVAWGYDSWNHDCPQRRPLKSTGLYAENSRVYHFARHFGGDRGWGYWEGAEDVYLIKTGFLDDATSLNAFMFDEEVIYLKPNNNWTSDSAYFVAHFWNGSGNADAGMTKVSDGLYMANVPSGSWSNVLFYRKKPSDGSTWNQTGDLTFNNGKIYTLSDGAWNGSTDSSDGSWSAKQRQKSDFPGVSLTAMKYYSSSGTGPDVYKRYPSNVSKQVYKTTQNSLVFRNIIFSNGSNAKQTKNLVLFPGCFYEPAADKNNDGKWYGALDDNGRDASASSGGESGGNDGGTDIGGDSTEGYNGGSGGFKIIIGENTYHAVSKQTSNGTEYKVLIGGLSSGTHEIKIYKDDNQYKNGDSQGYKIYNTSSNMSLYITTGAADHNQEIGIQNFSSGNFIVTFHYDNWDSNRDTIMISSILKQG